MSGFISIYYKLPYRVKNLVAGLNGMYLNHLRTKSRSKFISEASERDKWTKVQIKEWQQNKLRETLSHAYKTVPYYIEYWNQKLQEDPGINVQDLSNWPIISKDIIRDNPLKFISNDYKVRNLIVRHSSGTSGKPMTFYIDRTSFSHWYALYDLRIKRWNGVDEKMNWATVAGQLIVLQKKVKPPFWVWNSAMHQLYMSSYHLNVENIKYYTEAIKEYKVKYLLGYVSSLYSIAFLSSKQKLEFPDLKLIITNAEPLQEQQRQFMQSVFKCPVIQTYSGNEFAFGGNEYLDNNLYLWPESGIVETIDENGNFNSPEIGGELVTTGLINKAMPLIRYKVGDYIKLKPEESTKDNAFNFEVVEEITGRIDDLIKTSDGRIVGRLDPVFKTDLKIKEAQIIQHKLDEIEILVVPDTNFSENDISSIIERTQDRVGRSVKVYLNTVSSIPRGANGKFKAVVSNVKRNI